VLTQSLSSHLFCLGHSYYASSESLSNSFYEGLLFRGWRRSGTLLYKPDQRVSCCPHYTIRLDALAFKASKDQRQALNRFNRHILGEDYIKECARLHPKTRQETARRKCDFDLLERVHECELYNVESPPKPAHELVVTLESNAYTEEKYALFENYQRIVHKEPPSRITRPSFRSFLCTSPLKPATARISEHTRLLGSYHQCYRLDGVLVALGVVDLLPNAVSTVYFMYHESIHTWSPGKLSALREIALAVESGRRWYMMGFYIHACRKMRYKGDFHPQYIQDPESYTWDLLDNDIRRRLDARKYVSLSRERKEGILTPDAASEQVQDEQTNMEIEQSSIDYDSDEYEDDETLNENVPLTERNMPGIPSRAELLSSGLLDHVRLRIGTNCIVETSDLIAWEGNNIDDPQSIKGTIADLVAAVGLECAQGMIVTFG
jgi:arginyl-tRNA---protein transferase